MDNLKGIIVCSECGKKLRIPFDKHIIFYCPKCKTKFEYQSGNKIDFVEPRPIDLVEPRPRKFPKYTFLLFLFFIGFTSLIIYSLKPKTKDYLYSSKPKTEDYLPKEILPPIIYLPWTHDDDTMQSLDSALVKALQDNALDLAKDIAEKMLGHIIEDMKENHHDHAKKDFEIMKSRLNSGSKIGSSVVSVEKATMANVEKLLKCFCRPY